MTVARWSLPFSVTISVMSPSQTRSRLTESGAAGRLPGLVRPLRRLTTRATRPSSAISFATVFTEMRQPQRTSRVKILG